MNDEEEMAAYRGSSVRRVVLDRGEDGLVLRLWLERPDGSGLHLEFRGVRDLRFRREAFRLPDAIVLSLTDISSRGWEDLHYEVWDIEEEFVSFLCREVRSRPYRVAGSKAPRDGAGLEQ